MYDGEIKDDCPRWEYQCVESVLGDNYQTFSEKLSALGFSSWEVISITEINDRDMMNPSGYFWKAWLKRKYRFERKRVFDSDLPGQSIPFGGELRDYVYYV